jgi:Flp pilus assembly protein TadD
MSKDEMLDVIARAERVYRRIGSPRRIHVGLYRKGFALLHLGDVDQAREAIVEMASLEAPDWPARAVVQRLNLLGAAEAVQGRFEDSVAAFRDAAALLQDEPGENDVVLNVLGNLCMSLLGATRHEEALAVAADVLSRRPSPAVTNSTLRAMLIALTFLGRLDEAREIAQEGMPGWLADDMLPHMLSMFAWLAYLQGRMADALRLDAAAQTQVARMGLSNTPVFDRARTLLAEALAGSPVAAADLSRWRQEGERLAPGEIAALCIGGPVVDAAGQA